MSQNQEPGWWRPVWEAGRLDPSHAQQRDKFSGRDSAPDIGCTHSTSSKQECPIVELSENVYNYVTVVVAIP